MAVPGGRDFPLLGEDAGEMVAVPEAAGLGNPVDTFICVSQVSPEMQDEFDITLLSLRGFRHYAIPVPALRRNTSGDTPIFILNCLLK